MSNTSQSNTPRRPLRADFTKQVLHNAATARRRAKRKQQFTTYIKDLKTMKTIRFMRTLPGAALGLAVIAAGSVGVYAFTNWFGGNVSVTQSDASTLSIDLSTCQGTLPPGIEQSANRHDIKFKVTGNPHISAQDLQQLLLGECENRAVHQFYASKYPEANFDGAKVITGQVDPSNQYLLIPATIDKIASSSISLHYSLGKGAPAQQTLTVANDATIYNASSPATLTDLRPGDMVMVVVYSAGANSHLQEGTSIFDNANVQIKSIFKTQYNDSDYGFNYERDNVMPLDAYNALQK